ncbi:MAG: lysophospholipid acyltransferase family protein [Bdellovibrionaceae bacterium]|nr:lysophospholipid acyltransferase family protein [Pseudobdellovibrionaceae bacterium]
MSTSLRLLVDLLCKVWSLLPRRLVRALGVFLGILWFDVLRIRRKVMLDNLDIAFPDLDPGKKKQIARTSLYRFGSNFSEFFTLPSLDQKWIESHLVVEGKENLEAARAQGKGVYLLGMHLGNGDLTASLISMLGYPIHIITKFFKNKAFNDMWFHIRGAQGVKFIEPHGEKTPFQILRAIREKEFVAFVLDQYMGPPYGIETSFFGRKTGTAMGLALFFLKTGSPVVPVYSYEGSDNKMHIVFLPALDLEALVDTQDRGKTILSLTQKFCDTIEECVRRHPEEWLWVHRRWKEFG